MATPDDIRAGQLRWRCRRGTRELDRLLDAWLSQRFAAADAGTREDFSRLLDAQDPDLWDWLIGHERPDDAALARLVDEIRACRLV